MDFPSSECLAQANNEQKQDVAIVLSLPRALWGEAWLALQSGQEIKDLRRYAVSVVRREEQETGWVKLDAEENFLQIAGKGEEEIERWRVEVLDSETEKMLEELREGGAAVGKRLGLSDRRGQQLVREAVTRAEAGDLFGWGG